MNKRIIPTRVGKRHGMSLSRKNIQDHPHACGEKYTNREDK